MTYTVSVQNDATVAEQLRLRGQASTTAFTVRYFSPAGINITPGVTAGTFRTPVLAPGGTYAVKVQVTVTSRGGVARPPPGRSPISTRDATKTDTVKFITRRR